MVPEQDDGPGKSTDEQPAFKGGAASAPPAFMYVHFLPEIEQQRYPVYLFQIDPFQIEDEIKDAIDAILGKKVLEVKPTHNGKVEWKTYSYIVFVLNSQTSEIDWVDLKHQGTSDNHSFILESKLPRYKTCTAVYYLNKRKNKNNAPLGNGEKDIVEWEVHHSQMIKNSSGRIVNHQNSDPNTGP